VTNEDDDLAYEVDLETGLTRRVPRQHDAPYEPPLKSERETPAQVQDRLQRQRRHQLDLDITDLRNKAGAAQAECERLLARHQAIAPIEGPDPVRTNIYVEMQTQRRLAAWYRKRADRLELKRDR
jgi:hypothetical protein